MSSKWVYQFNEGDKSMKNLLGGKGANLAEMTSIGLPVPPGFTLTTEVCNHYSASASYPEGVEEQVAAALAALEVDTGKTFGDAADPLLQPASSRAAAPAVAQNASARRCVWVSGLVIEGPLYPWVVGVHSLRSASIGARRAARLAG